VPMRFIENRNKISANLDRDACNEYSTLERHDRITTDFYLFSRDGVPRD
jgi:hypothetical protein